MSHRFFFDVDINVINHLGVGLYSSTPAALTELVANAWDADATKVTIRVDPAQKSIIIEDDGHGMSAEDLSGRFLRVGYSRRLSEAKEWSQSKTRRVMGRKGIGKLAMFALAEDIVVSSQATGRLAVGFRIDVPEFRKALQNRGPTDLEEIEPEAFSTGHGTRIELRRVLPSLRTATSYLKVRLARRFGVIDDDKGFELFINDSKITRSDRGFYDKVQFLWSFDERSKSQILPLATNIAIAATEGQTSPVVFELEGSVPDLPGEVRGYIASVRQPRDLGSKEDSANVLSVFANGRVFSENILPDVSNAMYYQNYLVGEVHADFLDQDDVDRATASREAVKRGDPRYEALLEHIRNALRKLGADWDAARADAGLDEEDPANDAIVGWLTLLQDSRDRKLAKRIVASIQNATIHADAQKNEEAKRLLYKGAIVGFEKLRNKRQLERISELTDVLSPEFAAIFSGLQEIEEGQYADITRQRLSVIQEFDRIASDVSTLEKVAQKYLFKHLWLLDPTWSRVSGSAEIEKTLTRYLKKEHPDSTGARVDISYRAGSGRHVIVELKRPAIQSIEFGKVFEQVSKYRDAIHAYYRQTLAAEKVPDLDIYVLVARVPPSMDEQKHRALREISGRFITYQQMIHDAKSAYQEYLDVTDTTSPLGLILDRLS